MSKNCILILGKTGMGKSTLGNKLLKTNDFKIGHNLVSCTREPESRYCSALNAYIIDSVGFGDVTDQGKNLEDSEVFVSFMKYIYEKDYGIKCIIWCCEEPRQERKEQYFDIVIKFMKDHFPECLTIMTYHFKNTEYTPDGEDHVFYKYKDVIADKNTSKGKLYTDGSKIDTYYNISGLFYFSLKLDEKNLKEIIDTINLKCKSIVSPVKTKVKCKKCLKEGDDMWMKKDKCSYHQFKVSHLDRVPCHLEGGVKCHKFERRNTVFGKLADPGELLNHITNIHKIIQYVAYVLAALFIAYQTNYFFSAIVVGMSTMYVYGHLNGTYRCCNGKEPCDFRWKCCRKFQSDIDEAKKKSDEVDEFCGVKCTKCSMKKYWNNLERFENNGCGLRCEGRGEHCRDMFWDKNLDKGKANETGCISEYNHNTYRVDLLRSVISKSITDVIGEKLKND